MPVDTLLAELHRRGVKLRLAEAGLDVVAPPGALDDALREQLRAGRDELVGMLRRQAREAAPAAVVPDPARRGKPFPLTDIQHAYWVGRALPGQLGGTSAHYYFELERAGLDPAAMQRALRKVIARHDLMRAVVQPDGSQRVLAEVPDYQLFYEDLGELRESAAAARLAEIRAEMSHQTLPAGRWPLFDFRVTRVPGGRVRTHVYIDNIFIDAASLYTLMRDWQRFYEDPGWRPEPLELAYRDYALAEQARRGSEEYRQAERYWLDRAESLPPAPALPLAASLPHCTDPDPAPRDAVRPGFTRRHREVPAGAWTGIKDEAKRRGLTPSAVLLAVYADTLRLWSDQQAFTVNLTLFDRRPVHPQVGDIVGDFTSVTLLECAREPGDGFADRAREINLRLMRDLGHSAYSGVRVLQERARRSGSGPSAAMPVVFTSALTVGREDAAGPDPAAGMRFFGEFGNAVSETPQVWLDHQVTERDGVLQLDWDAPDGLFPAGLLDEMFAAYGDAVDRLHEDPGAWDSTGPLAAVPARQLAERERANDTAAPLPAVTLVGLVEQRAARQPGSPAVIAHDGVLTYAALIDRARRLGHRLAALGAATGELVAVGLDKGRDQAAAVLGIGMSGAAYLPVDPAWPAARRAELIRQGMVRIVIGEPGSREAGHWPREVVVIGFDDPEVASAGTGPLDARPEPGDLAYVIFTSGSTGTPKGVAVEHAAAANTVQDINARFGVGPQDRVLGLSALSFDLSVYDVFGTLAAGAALVLPDPALARDPAHWTDLARRHRVTVWNSVPALMQAWTDAPADPGPDSPLRLVLLSGDWIPVRLPDAVRARHPRAEVISLGGATEAAIWSVVHPVGEVPGHWTSVPYGTALANQTMEVLGADLAPCPEWTTGEIFLGGAGLARGYWGDAARTAEKFPVNPRTGRRLYRTGDLGRYLPGGIVEFLGRGDFQVKINGYRIELGEIAAALCAVPGVADAVATVHTAAQGGGRALAAYAVPADPAAPPEPEDLRILLKASLPSYMVPQHIAVIGALPLTANGKVDRAALPAPEPAPDDAAAEPPADGLERAVYDLWVGVLGYDGFGVVDNLFEIGGDSLHAIRLLGLVRSELGLACGPEDGVHIVFENPTVRELAAALGGPAEGR